MSSPARVLASSMAARSVQTPFGTSTLSMRVYCVAQMPSLSGTAPATSDELLTVKTAA